MALTLPSPRMTPTCEPLFGSMRTAACRGADRKQHVVAGRHEIMPATHRQHGTCVHHAGERRLETLELLQHATRTTP
jgi:hypothetical protein